MYYKIMECFLAATRLSICGEALAHYFTYANDDTVVNCYLRENHYQEEMELDNAAALASEKKSTSSLLPIPKVMGN